MCEELSGWIRRDLMYFTITVGFRVSDISKETSKPYCIYHTGYKLNSACGVMVIVTGNGHGDTSSNPGWDWLHFT